MLSNIQINKESLGGFIILICAVCALIMANSSLQDIYDAIISAELGFNLFGYNVNHSVQHYINDFLMLFFFMQVGIEIKHELQIGYLSSRAARVLPLIATIAGVVLPAAIFLLFNYNHPENIKGWAMPVVTDIAFAICIASFFTKSLPPYLKVFLLSLAIFDDLIGIIIIALFYSTPPSAVFLLLAALTLFAMIYCNRNQILGWQLYCILATILWFFVAQSGVHPTIAGVLIALAIPYREIKFLPNIVAYFITPLFAFANSGVGLNYLNWDTLLDPLSLGVICGLFFGKQLGVFLVAFLLLKSKLVVLPFKISYLQLYGVSALTGIGFTVSMFIGDLAFNGSESYNSVRISIMLASVASAVCGFALLKIAERKAQLF